MKSDFCEERADCCHVLEERYKWIMSLFDIRESKEYKDFINQYNNNSITDESLVKYAKYHFQL